MPVQIMGGRCFAKHEARHWEPLGKASPSDGFHIFHLYIRKMRFTLRIRVDMVHSYQLLLLAQTIKLPSSQHIPGLECLEALRQRWPLDMRSGCLTGAYLLASCPFQGSQVPIEGLIIRGDATIADFHRGMSLIYDTHNYLCLQR